MKKLFFCLSLILIFTFTACQKDSNEPADTSPGDKQSETGTVNDTGSKSSDTEKNTVAPDTESNIADSNAKTSAENTTQSGQSKPYNTEKITTTQKQEHEPPAPNAKQYVLAENGNTNYIIIYSSGASEDIASSALSIKGAFNRKLGVSIRVGKDKQVQATANEILVGVTNRYSSSDIGAGLTYFDYNIFVKDGRVIIAGGSDRALMDAVHYFADNIIPSGSSAFLISENFRYEYRHSYPIQDLSIGGTSIADFTLVYGDGNLHALDAAEAFQAFITEHCGKTLPIVSDSTPAASKEIRFGSSSRINSYLSKAEIQFNIRNGNLNILCGTPQIIPTATQLFIDDYLNQTGTIKLSSGLSAKYRSLFLGRSDSIKIACIGDSLTAGATSSDETTKAYPPQMKSFLGSNFEIANYGVGGATMISTVSLAYTKTEQYSQSLSYNPDIVIIMLGTNDAAPAFVQDIPTPQQPTAFLQSATQIIQSYRNLSSKPDIFVMTSVQVLTQNSRKRLLETVFMPLQKQAAKDNSCNLIDIFAQTGNIETLYSDGLHLTDDGYRYLAGLVLNGIVDHYGFTK